MASGTITTPVTFISRIFNNVTSVTANISNIDSNYGALWILTGRHYSTSAVYGAIGVFSGQNGGTSILCSSGFDGLTSVIEISGSDRLLKVSWNGNLSYAHLKIISLFGVGI